MRPIRYVLWSLLVILPLLFAWVLHSGALLDTPWLGSYDLGPMTSILAVAAFMVTALIAPGIVDSRRKDFPAWSIVAIVAGFAQLFVLLFVYGGSPTDAWSAAYVPGAVVILNLAAMILVHIWVACEGFRFPLVVGFGLGGACASWIIQAGSATEFGVFHAASGIVLGVGLIAGIVIALMEKPEPAPTAH